MTGVRHVVCRHGKLLSVATDSGHPRVRQGPPHCAGAGERSLGPKVTEGQPEGPSLGEQVMACLVRFRSCAKLIS